jgi:hypothetical protein
MAENDVRLDGDGRTVGVFGATGFIGQRLVGVLREEGWKVVEFSRKAGEGRRSSEGVPDLSGLAGVVNLAGESVAQRWTDSVRERLRSSRVELTGRIVDAIGPLPEAERPRWLVNASAIGFYGDGGEGELTEQAACGDGYLAELCRDWEEAAQGAAEHGVRVVAIRLGIVLGRGGDAWTRLSRVFKLGGGGKLGNGRQWMPWVHVDDVVGAIRFVIGQPGFAGAVNVTAPGVVRNAEFTRVLAERVRRPAVFRVPGFALKLALGGFGGTLVESARVVPQRLREAGFEFRYPGLEAALEELV